MNPIYIVIAVVVGLGLYYVFYFKRIGAAGGSKAAGKTYWREQLGLADGEDVVSLGVGMWYLGPLVPETVRSTGEKVFDALTGTTYRGASLWLGFSSRDRFAIAVEETEDGPKSQRGVLGTKSGYAPLIVYEPTARPRMETAELAWPGSKHLPTDKQKPDVTNFQGQKVKLELVRLTEPDGHTLVFFVEPAWAEAIGVWCSGGPARVEPQFVS